MAPGFVSVVKCFDLYPKSRQKPLMTLLSGGTM